MPPARRVGHRPGRVTQGLLAHRPVHLRQLPPLPQPLEPGHELLMHRVGPAQVSGNRPVSGVDQHRPGLPAAQPAMAADKLLERGHLAGCAASK
jgi:hypothetical protein